MMLRARTPRLWSTPALRLGAALGLAWVLLACILWSASPPADAARDQTARAYDGLAKVATGVQPTDDPRHLDISHPDLAISKQPASQQVRSGDTIVFTLSVTNTSSVTLANVAVADDLTPDCARTVGELPAEANVTYTCTLTQVTLDFTNIATATADPDILATSSAGVDVINPAIALAKLPASQQVRYGETVTFSIRVTNTGDVVLSGVTVSDPLAPNCVRSLGGLNPGQVSSYTCTQGNVTADFTNLAIVSAAPPVGDPLVASAAAQVAVLAPAPQPGYAYLPLLLKQAALTWLFVTSDNTGGIRLLEVRNSADNSLVQSCENIPNDVVAYPCGSFPPGTYQVIAHTARCGTLRSTKTWSEGSVTIRVYCN